MWIREKNNYAIIIENKIHEANDTDNQLSNYIEKTHNHGLEYEQIFIIYLNEKDPDEQSWGNYIPTLHGKIAKLTAMQEEIENISGQINLLKEILPFQEMEASLKPKYPNIELLSEEREVRLKFPFKNTPLSISVFLNKNGFYCRVSGNKLPREVKKLFGEKDILGDNQIPYYDQNCGSFDKAFELFLKVIEILIQK